jgi:hypothetical protein
MEPKGSSPYTQQPATCPYPEPDQSSLCPPPNLSKIHFNIILPKCAMLKYKTYKSSYINVEGLSLWIYNYLCCCIQTTART